MIFQTDVNWLEEKFTDCSVALALTIVNASNEFALNHVETYFHDGCGDPFYNVPASIDPKVCFKTTFLFYFLLNTVEYCYLNFQSGGIVPGRTSGYLVQALKFS